MSSSDRGGRDTQRRRVWHKWNEMKGKEALWCCRGCRERSLSLREEKVEDSKKKKKKVINSVSGEIQREWAEAIHHVECVQWQLRFTRVQAWASPIKTSTTTTTNTSSCSCTTSRRSDLDSFSLFTLKARALTRPCNSNNTRYRPPLSWIEP